MTAITRVDNAHPAPQVRERQHTDCAAVEFGRAVTYRDLVQAKSRVDPAALADRKRAPESTRSSEPRDDRDSRVDISV